jgi:hypothetical protein
LFEAAVRLKVRVCAIVEEQAMKFEEQKDYLIKIWNEKSEKKARSQR